jgi:dienelactone hydrolase
MMRFALPQSWPQLATSFALVASSVSVPSLASASADAVYEEVATYETTIPATDDPADVYYPVLPIGTEPERFPLVLMLQGAFVDKANYTNFASEVASYGFVVIVPNHERTVLNPRTNEQVTGFAAEQRQVHDVLNYVEMLAADPTSPLDDIVDPDRYALVGHSLGGYVGLSAIRGSCLPFICTGDSFTPPLALDAAVFYGTTFEAQPRSGNFLPIANSIPVALIAGSEDGEADYDRVVATYEQIQNPPKALIRVEGANHYGITNENNPDRAVNPPLIEQDQAIATIAYWTGQFLRAHLWDDAVAFELVYGADNPTNEVIRLIEQSEVISK